MKNKYLNKIIFWLIIFAAALCLASQAQPFQAEEIGDGCCGKFELDPAGHVHLLYLDGQGAVRYETNATGSWQGESLYGTNWVMDATLSLDPAGNPHIVYAYDDNGEAVVTYQHLEGGTWSAPEEVTRDFMGAWSLSLVVTANGERHLAYMKAQGMASQGDLLYMSDLGDGNGWTLRHTVSNAYDRLAMALDSAHQVHLCYYSIFHNGLRYATNAGGTFSDELVDAVGGQLEGMVTDIAIDRHGNPHISYVGGPMEDQRHATKTGGSWQITTLEPGDRMSAGTAIALDVWDNVFVSYYQYGADSLHFVYREGGNWSPILTVDAGGMSNDLDVDRGGGVHLVYEKNWKVYYTYFRYLADMDLDGVPDREEQGPLGSDPSYDGNIDMVPDYRQVNVTSLHTYDREGYVTFSIPTNLQLGEVVPMSNPDPANSPADEFFDAGFFSFQVLGLAPAGSVTVTLDLHGQGAPRRYWKYGPSPTNSQPHWYEFDHDGTTGARVQQAVVFLDLVDGQRGDADLTADGVIHEPGGPGFGTNAIESGNDLRFRLEPNHPNPFSTFTILPFHLQEATRVRLSIVDLMGREWTVLRDELLPPGQHEVIWQSGQAPAGVYLWRLETAEGSLSRRMLLVE
jgi:hypothetical protein